MQHIQYTEHSIDGFVEEEKTAYLAKLHDDDEHDEGEEEAERISKVKNEAEDGEDGEEERKRQAIMIQMRPRVYVVHGVERCKITTDVYVFGKSRNTMQLDLFLHL